MSEFVITAVGWVEEAAITDDPHQETQLSFNASTSQGPLSLSLLPSLLLSLSLSLSLSLTHSLPAGWGMG